MIPESTSKLSDFLFKPENRVTWDKALKMYNIVLKIDSVIYCLMLDFYCINSVFLYLSISLYYICILYIQIKLKSL